MPLAIWRRSCLSLLLTTSLAGPALADIDLTGRWFTPQSTTRFADVVQTGSDVTLSWTTSSGPVTYTGTFDQTRVVAWSATDEIRLTPRAAGDILYGSAMTYSSLRPTLLRRCECYDGNTDDLDGCDSECRAEECYTCTGEPSACVPSADAAPCDDRSDCSTGETCTSGSCGGGTPVSPCIDLGGLWRVNSGAYAYFGEEQPGQSDNVRFVQQDGSIFLYNEQADPGDMPYAVGEIDPSSGTMSYQSTNTRSVFCSNGFGFGGEATSDAATFGGTLYYSYDARIGSCSVAAVDATGTRCHATLGCDLADCSGLPDGTPCRDSDVCTSRDACSAGTCAARYKCPACQYCDGDGDCSVGSRSGCAVSPARRSSQLLISRSTDRDKLRWFWKKGTATAIETFGDPTTTNEMALCIYDADDELVYRNDVSPDEACEEPPCWEQTSERLSFKGSGLALSLRAGTDGRAAISFKSSEQLPYFEMPLAVPLRVQLQIDNGACFSSYFRQDSVTKNEGWIFKAKAPE
jgi:hypothetical protein